jgi:hypothetical protein
MQVDLIDFQGFKDGDYRFLMVYQDHGVKIPWLEPIVHKTAGVLRFRCAW